ncbi:MAG: YigZ family protein [Clostridiales bacterium]|nr:YigZ family protein [Clostridiales bacterium]
MEEKRYVTLGRTASAEMIERKSRFIGHAAHVESVEEANAFIDKIKAEYSDATHNVYAYEINGGAAARASDDGEPSGTAGIPVLDVIRKSGFTDAVIVVTRYFGGILLGAGGLVRAYSAAAKLAVDAAGIVELGKVCDMTLTCQYQDLGRLQNELPKFGATIGEIDYGADVTIIFTVAESGADELCARVSEMTGGKVLPELLETRYGTV